MAPRPFWTGHVRLSLVSFPVRLYAAVAGRESVSLHMIHEPSGERVRYQKIVPDIGPVADKDIVKGFEYERGHYVTLDDEDLEKVRIESRDTIDLVQFVDTDEVDPIYFERPYWVVPDSGTAEEAFVVIREALRKSGKIALGQVVFSSREHMAALQPCGKGMLLETLRYADQLRDAESYFAQIRSHKLDPEQLNLAVTLIERKTAAFDPDKFKDHYVKALREMIQAKLGKKKLKEPEERPTAQVINLMDALKMSVAGGGKAEPKPRAAPKRKAAPRKAAAKKPAARRKAS